MSKKKNKKSKKNKNHSYYYESYTKKDKKKDKDKKIKSAYGKPELKHIKPTIDKKDAKAARKLVTAPVEVPKEFRKIREKCNHAGNLITAEEFKAMTPAYAAFTPMLDAMIALFGAENVHICKSCYDVIVPSDSVGLDEVRQAVTMLYAAVNCVVTGTRMKSDEVKKLSKLKDGLNEFNLVAELMLKRESRHDPKKLDIDSLNRVGNGAYTL